MRSFDRLSISRGLGELSLAVVASTVVGLVVSGRAPAALLLVVVGATGLAAFLFCPAEWLPAVVVATLGAFQLSDAHPFNVGPASVYSTDLLLLALLLRAGLPRARAAASKLPGWLVVPFGLWVGAMGLATLKGMTSGSPPDTVVRLGGLLIYPVGYFVGARELFREMTDWPRALRLGAVVVLAFVGWMLFQRAAGTPFEQVNQLGKVVTASGDVLRRDYGFSSAFILYPLLGLLSFAYLMELGKHLGSAVLATTGIIATSLTLIRGETYGLVLGIIVITLLSPRVRGATSARVRSLVTVGGLLAIALGATLAIAPSFGSGILQRSIPFLTPEGARAQETADYRAKALDAGFAAAGRAPLGAGFVTEDAMRARGVDPGYLNHSAPAWLLGYTGWPGFLTTAALLVALIFASFGVPGSRRWVHSGFVGCIVALAAYSLTASGIVGQPWIGGLLGMLIAFRFTPPPTTSMRLP